MTIYTDYLGEVEYQESDLLYIPDGLFGFPSLHSYLPFNMDDNDDSLILLQSVENLDISFLTINPVFLLPDYDPTLTPEELHFLGVSEPGELSYYALCSIQNDFTDCTVNLKCPLAINPATRTGVQLLMENTSYSFRHALSSFPAMQPGRKADVEDSSLC